jgi:hypothetical protein
MGIALHQTDFEAGYAGAAFIGHAFALLRLVKRCRAKLSMTSIIGVLLPTVGRSLLIAASEVSFFSHLMLYVI